MNILPTPLTLAMIRVERDQLVADLEDHDASRGLAISPAEIAALRQRVSQLSDIIDQNRPQPAS